MSAASLVISTVNAPCAEPLSASELAACLVDISAAKARMGPVLSFLSEVNPSLQMAFLAEMGVSLVQAKPAAEHFAQGFGMDLAMAGVTVAEDDKVGS